MSPATIDREKAERCPFCMSTCPNVSYFMGLYNIRCADVSCDATGPRRETPEEALKAWSTRFRSLVSL